MQHVLGVGFLNPFLVLLASALPSLGPLLGKAADPDNPSQRFVHWADARDDDPEAEDHHRRAPIGLQ